MTDWKLPWPASCLCGQVRMRVTKPAIISAACHCPGCQKLTGGAYALTLMLPPDGFEILSGETEIGGRHRPDLQHNFCTHCKAWVYTAGPALGGNFNLRPTMLEDASWFKPLIETYASTKLPGVETGAEISFEEFPPMEQFESLAAAYQARGARPR